MTLYFTLLGPKIRFKKKRLKKQFLPFGGLSKYPQKLQKRQNGTIFDPNQKCESTKLIDMDHMKPSITKFGNSIKYWKKYMVNGDYCNGVVNSYISELAFGKFTEFIYHFIFSVLDNMHKTFYQ